jgi:hypothetical protein
MSAPDLAALLGGKLGGELPKMMGGLDSAQQMWAMLDDMAQSDPAAYAEFMRTQVSAMKSEEAAALPTPCFCARVHVSEPPARAGALFVNAGSHRSIKPAASPTDAVNLAVSVLRDVLADRALVTAAVQSGVREGDPLAVVDVITSEDHLARARCDAEYRRELCDLFVECIEQTHGLRIKRGSVRVLSLDRLKYAGGEPKPFRDARAPAAEEPAGSAEGEGATAAKPSTRAKVTRRTPKAAE